MRRHQLITAGISLALLVGGAAAPVLAAPGRINGAARSANVAWFTIDVREERLPRGSLDYTSVDGRFKVRCMRFTSYTRTTVAYGPPAAKVTADCVLEGPRRRRTPIKLEAEFVDHSSFTRGAKDEANFTFIIPGSEDVTDSGRILSGGITVR